MFAHTAIFTFELPGYGPRCADPLAVRRRLLLASSGRLWEWASRAREIQKALAGIEGEGDVQAAQRAEWSTQLAAIEGDLALAAYAAFDGLQPINPENGQGQTEAVVLQVLGTYLAWLEEKKGESGTVS